MGAGKKQAGPPRGGREKALDRLVENFLKLPEDKRKKFSARVRETVNQRVQSLARRSGQGNRQSGKTRG